ncbi:hypothetical protein BGZ54_004533 [Gamsiella multidivaricata]|nr:hypothetical protein BGZ54_004533 [Gamsiella multidivaricata]
MEIMVKYQIPINMLIESIFESSVEEVEDRVKAFYSRNCHASLIQSWYSWCRTRSQRDSFARAACDLVVLLIQGELKRVSRSANLQIPSTKITQQAIQHFELSAVTDAIETEAWLLSNLLNGLTSDVQHSYRTPASLVSTIASMLLFHRNRSCNILQLVLGLHLFSTGAQRKTITIFSKAALSVSYSTITRTLRSLTQDALRVIKDVAEHHPCRLYYDNINIASKRYDQRLSNVDTFDSGATATLVIGDNLDEPDLVEDSYAMLDYYDLLPDSNASSPFKKVCKHHIVHELLCYHDLFSRCSQHYPPPIIRQLEPTKSMTFPLPSMKIDQATVDGNISIINKIFVDILGLPGEFFENGKQVAVGGDLFTIKRLHTMRKQRSDDVNAYERMEWIIPVMQLFHLQMVLAKAILRTHYGMRQSPGSLAFFQALLNRKRINLDNPEFHALDEFLRHCYRATVLRAWESTSVFKNWDKIQDEDLDDDQIDTLVHGQLNQIIEQFINKALLDEHDTASRNAALFMRDMTHYIELSSAIKAGDIVTRSR